MSITYFHISMGIFPRCLILNTSQRFEIDYIIVLIIRRHLKNKPFISYQKISRARLIFKI